MSDRRGNRWVGLAVAVAVIGSGVALTGRFPTDGTHFGPWSVVPPVVALVLAFTLRDVIAALFIGIALGGVISGRLNVVQEFLIPSVGTPAFGLILLVYLWALGGLIGLWTRTGGAMRFADWAGSRVARGPRSAMLFTWAMGVVFHQGGTISTVLTGTTVRPVGDRHRVSHEELSYIVDSTASPVASVVPFNVWPIYVGGLVAGTVPVIPTQEAGITFFFRAVPFNFYALLAVGMTFLVASERWPLVPRGMRRARDRARATGALDRDGAEPLAADELTHLSIPEGYSPSLLDFFGPIGTLLAVAIIPFFVTFYLQGNRESPSLPIAEAFVLAVLAGMAIALIRGMKLRDAMEGIVDGCKGVTIGAVVLALAVTLKSVAEALGTAEYVVQTVGPWVSPVALPGVLLLVTMFVAFSTGTSWGTYAVLFPVSMPLAWAVHPDPTFLALCFGAVIGGSVFGDQCSPISDTTILSSVATGCDLMDHTTTQIPLALMAAGGALILYTLLAAMTV